MSARPHPLRWVPAFLVGVSTATAAEVAVGLLLYSGPGLLRSLTIVLGVEAAALGVGVWTAPGPTAELLDSLRRRWLLCLVAFLVATLFGAFWSVVQAVGGGRLGQGLGLALMGALPLYACGSVMGGMASANAGSPPGEGIPTGAPAFLGAALGFGATGISLPQVLTPASLLLVCLVLLSAGGLVYGSVLEAHLRIYVRARRVASAGDVRVEDRHLLSRDGAARFLLEGEHVRRWVSLVEEESPVPWDVAAFRGLVTADGAPCRVLLVGGGASTLPRTLAQLDAPVLLDVTERAPEVLELAREHMDAGIPESGHVRAHVHVGNASDLVESLSGPYDLVLVDSAAYAAVGGFAAVSRRFQALLWSRLEPAGALVVGPPVPDQSAFAPPDGWRRARYRRAVSEGLGALETGLPADEVMLVVRPSATGALPADMDGFVREEGEGGAASAAGGEEEVG